MIISTKKGTPQVELDRIIDNFDCFINLNNFRNAIFLILVILRIW